MASDSHNPAIAASLPPAYPADMAGGDRSIEAGSDAGARQKIKPSITTALVLSFGALIIGGMILVLGISMWSAQKNTRALLADNAELAVLSLTREMRRRLAPVEEESAYLAELITSHNVDIADTDAVARFLLTGMAGTPQIFGMAFIFPDGRAIRVRRGEGLMPAPSGALSAGALAALREAQTRREPYWGRPLWIEAARATVISVRTPVWTGDTFRGFLVAGVTVSALSRFIARSGDAPLTANRFILYGRDHVLAHRDMEKGSYPRSADVPLPRLHEIGDPVLANIWNDELRRPVLLDVAGGVMAHRADIDGEPHLYLYREMREFGTVPLVVGIYIGPKDGLGAEFRRLIWAGVAGIAVIVVCVIGAVLVGRRMSAPIKELAAGSGAVADLELDRVHRLPPSRLRELDEASDAFNRMTTGLRWFETYVPRQLVRRLMEREAPVASEEKQVTVMFTDIAGFATLSEHMPAADTAALLNEHFTILADCIEEEHGTVDKYIGDSVMAFWEPDETGDNVDRALHAARAIRRRIRFDNARRSSMGEHPIGVRIGIHTGMAIVGNIGAPGRVNYTLVGDTVNVAARLEQLCKEMETDEDTVILVSADTAALAGDGTGLTDRGTRAIRGRETDIAIYSLD